MDHIGGNLKKLVKPSVAGMSLATRLGKLPPQAIELEEAVLGALMLERDAMLAVAGFLPAEAFYKDEHKLIFAAIESLYGKNKPIDILSVTNELRSQGKLEFIGGAYYISELTNRIGSAANVEYHSMIIMQKFILRQMIEFGSHIQEDAYEETIDVFDLLDDGQKRLFEIADLKGVRNLQSIGTLIAETAVHVKTIRESIGKEALGVPTYWADLDKLITFRRKDLIILAARPGMGKTAFITSHARRAALHGRKVGIFSLEMPALQLTMRMIADETSNDYERINNAELTDAEWMLIEDKLQQLREQGIYIDDTPSLNLFELKSAIRRAVLNFGIEEVWIDYLQLMEGPVKHGRKDASNREREIADISRGLKGLAKELNIPIIALSQLSREVDGRSIKRPVLKDLRESGSIEQDADVVIFLYRPEYYGEKETSEGFSTEGLCEVIVAKNRHGRTDTVDLKFIGKYMRFTDWFPEDFTNAGEKKKKPKKGGDKKSFEEMEHGPGLDFQKLTSLGERPIPPDDDDLPF